MVVSTAIQVRSRGPVRGRGRASRPRSSPPCSEGSGREQPLLTIRKNRYKLWCLRVLRPSFIHSLAANPGSVALLGSGRLTARRYPCSFAEYGSYGTFGTHLGNRRRASSAPWAPRSSRDSRRCSARPMPGISRSYSRKVEAINALEPKYQAMTDAELRGADRRVPPAAGGGRNARRPAGRGLCRLPRGAAAASWACGITTCR